jgi:lipid II:glycine glycyltransferase (peptidoglycan interpeptide bridge formation enzyme)
MIPEDIRQSPLWAKYLEKLGWLVEKIDGNFVYIKKIPFLGSFIKIQRVKNFDLKKIDIIRKKYRAFSIKIEPDISAPKNFINSLQKLNFKKDNFPLSLPKTIWIDLEKNEEGLWKNLKKDCRYCIKKAQGEKIKIKKSEDIDTFSKLWSKERERGLGPSQKEDLKKIFKVFGKNARIFFAEKGGEILGGALTLNWEKTHYYTHAFSTKKGRRSFVQYLVVWEIIKKARKSGCKIFDFEGIYDPRFHSTTKSWQGFSHFKKSFGGKEIEYPGTFSKTFFLLTNYFPTKICAVSSKLISIKKLPRNFPGS